MSKLHVIKVRANGSKLECYENSDLPVVHSAEPILIVIWLDNDPKDIEFEPLDSPLPFFNWQLDGPKTGVFSTPVRSPDGKRIVLDDHHPGKPDDTSPPAGWEYALRACRKTDPRTKYQTDNARQLLASGTRTPTTPVIINK